MESVIVPMASLAGVRAETAGAGPHRVLRTSEPTEYVYGESVLTAALLLAGFVLVLLYERARRGLAPERVLFTPWGLEDVLLGMAVFFLGLILLTVVLAVSRAADVPMWTPPTAVSGIVTCLVVLLHLNRRYGLQPVDLGLRFDRWGHDLLLSAGMLVFVFGLQVPMSGFVHFLYDRAGEPFVPQFVITQLLEERSWWRLGLMVVVAVTVAPMWEEIAFRGFVQPFLRHRLGGAGAVVATAVLFSLIHDPRSKFGAVPFMVFPLALALGYCYERTQRLAAPILLHALHNLLSVVAVLAQRGGS